MIEDAILYGERFLSAAYNSPFIQVPLFLLQLVGILLSFLLLGGIIFLLFKTNYVGGKKKNWKRMFDPEPGATDLSLSEDWNSIRARLKEGYKNYSQLILDATALMEHFLQDAGYAGQTLEDQLAHVTPAEIRNMGDVLAAWRRAKELRQQDEPHATFEEAQMVIGAYETALGELGMFAG